MNAAQIRQSVIIHWLKTRNLREVQYMVGHKYVSSTERYQTNNLDNLQGKLERYHPLNQIQKSEIKTLNLQKMNVMKTYQFTAEITRDNEVNQYIGIIPGLQGAHTQAPTLDELQINLKEVIQLCLGEMTEEEINNIPDFVGFQQISVAI